MKKNLRIVSAAAAALLAVAPVAASAVSVNAADSTATTTANATNSNSGVYTQINAGAAINTNANAKYDVDVTPSLTAIAAVTNNGTVVSNGSLTGTISATYGGQSYTANLDTKNGNVSVVNSKGTAIANDKIASELTAGKYTVTISGVGFNFSTANANKENVTIGSANSNVEFSLDGKTYSKTVKVPKLDQNGTVSGLSVKVSNVNALNLTNGNGINFYEISNGNQVTNGSVAVTAGAQSKLNVSSVVAAIQAKYAAAQVDNKVATNQMPSLNEIKSDVESSLKAANTPVDNAGWFTAPTSFTVNVKATSSINGLTATLPVTVNVTNGVNTTVDSVSKTIMHNAYYYDKDAKRVGTDKLTRYNSVTVSPKTTTISGKAYYEVVENGKLSGKFINADNIDGTKRTLKHNAYVYKTSKKRANKVTLKKGTEVTTYGGTYTFKNGKQYYKIGNNTDKTYVKASNF
ncbi:SLAP domain-containing protein [Lactobacillus crispatus]|uniref:SLAP domain-containing protein n=1 Tax=Lactobacillus crispatus TaxID=47770 RepID=UPI0030F7B255